MQQQKTWTGPCTRNPRLGIRVGRDPRLGVRDLRLGTQEDRDPRLGAQEPRLGAQHGIQVGYCQYKATDPRWILKLVPQGLKFIIEA